MIKPVRILGLISALFIALVWNQCAVAATQTATPGTCVNDAGIGTISWGGLGNVAASDNNYATATVKKSEITNYLKCTGYGFTIPAGATINGITVSVEDHSARTIYDYAVSLVKGGTVQATNYGTLTNMPTSDATSTYGGAADLWGTTWTVANINNANFGVAFAAQRGPYNTNDTANVDYMPITVNYTLLAPPTATTNAATALTANGATLNGTVSSNGASTTVTFDYGLTAGYGSTIAATPSPLAAGASGAAVSAAVAGLACNTLYHFRVKGVNSAGTTNGGDLTFTTSACVPTATTSAATSLSTNGATLNGTVSSNGASTTVTFDYGTTVAYGSSATAAQSPLAAGASGSAVSAAVTGLTCGTLYHFRVKGVNSAGTTNGSDLSFTTSACAAPTVTTNAATSLTTSGATLNGTVSSNGASTTVTFDYGTTVSYGTSATAAESPLAATASSSAVTAAITGLTCGTLYHFRVKGVNTSGTSNGSDLTFTTSACPVPAVISINTASTNPTSPATAVAWTVVFNQAVTGVDTGDFALVQAGGVSGATITSVTGSGTTWTVNANTGSGGGTLGLNLVDNDSIVSSSSGVKLGGAGAGNGNFTGQVYTVSAFCSAPPNIPVGVSVSCVCDQFGRASLNPSTIFGGNWAVSHGTSDTAGTNPYINATTGLLRLTENTNNNAKAATVPSIFPAAGNYISVEFNNYAYQGGNTGADGIAVTLSDYSIPAVPGGFGGSLGYAQRNDGTSPPGFAGGWVGVALDEYGNFQNPTEGRIGGPGARAQSVGVRGPGSGANGYRYMGGTASSPGGYNISANSTSATPATGYMYQVIVDARNSSTGTINVSVNRDVTAKDGSAYTSLFGPFNAYTEANYAVSQGWISQIIPDFWKISFTGSTGGSTNVHEIGSLRICAQTVLPPTGGTASGFSAIDEAYPAGSGSTAPAYPNFQTGDIYMKLTGTPFKLWVGALTSTALSTGYSSVSNRYVQVKVVDNSDNACGTDAARTCNSTCTNKAAVEAGATQIALFPSGSSTGVASPSPSFTLNSSYKNLIAVMKECTTSSCAAFTATAPACSVDSFTVRPLSIATVTSSDATNTTTGGTPIFKAGGDNFNLTATTTGVSGNPSGYNGVVKMVVQPASPATVTGALTCTSSATTPTGTCTVGTPANTFPAATSGTPVSSATGTFTYSEVGAFQLFGYTPDATCTVAGSPLTVAQCNLVTRGAYDNTWTAIDSINTKNDCIANSYTNIMSTTGAFSSNPNFGKYGCYFGLLPNATKFGRFVPDHFKTVVTPVGQPCPTGLTCPAQLVPGDNGQGFFYSGQAFTTQVTALNAAGAVTQNYDSGMALSKDVTLSAYDSPGGSTANPPGGNGALTLNSIPSTSFSLGVATTSTPTYTFTAVNTAPTDIYLRAADTDGVTSNIGAASVEGGVKIISGRIKVSNAYGSELLPLPMTATVQYYDAAGNWVTSTTDDATSFNTASDVGKTIVQGPLTGADISVASAGLSVVIGGMKDFTLNPPGTGKTGRADISITAPTYLQSVAGRATFGVYQGNPNFIYRRESY